MYYTKEKPCKINCFLPSSRKSTVFINEHLQCSHNWADSWGGGGGTPYNGLYGEALPKRGAFFTLQVYERVGISRVKVHERVGKSVI